MAKETKKNKKEKNVKNDKKPFMKDFKSELKKVIWPTPKQLANSTSTVIVIVFPSFTLEDDLGLTDKTTSSSDSSS